jgi:integrase
VKLGRGDGTLRWEASRKRWRLIHSIDGHEHVEWGFDHEDCKAKRDARRARMRGEVRLVPGEKFTVRQMFEAWLANPATGHGRGRGTAKNSRWAADVIGRHCGARDALTITPAEIEGALVELSARYKSTPVLRSKWRQAHAHLIKSHKRTDNPVAAADRVMSNPELENVIEHLTEVEAVVALALFMAEPTREHAALATIMLAGPRPGEACALRWTEVDLAAGTIRIDFTVKRDERDANGRPLVSPKLKTDHHGPRHKAAVHRTVPMVAALVAILRRVRQEQMATGETSGFVFAKDGWALDPQDLYYASRAVSDRLGHENHVAPNGYRHTFAVRLALRGFPAIEGARLMGHVDSTQWDRTYAVGDTGITPNLDAWLAASPAERAS